MPQNLLERLAGTAEVRVTTRAEGTVYLEVAGVPVSIIRHRYPLIAGPEDLPGSSLRVASPPDPTAMKLPPSLRAALPATSGTSSG